ncbi:MAG: hypothetical protein J6X69_01085 [Bacteroidales bacterium]|nr:hypothetical protein [Bacteroidales bacterium]
MKSRSISLMIIMLLAPLFVRAQQPEQIQPNVTQKFVDLVVDTATVLGPIRPMNAVNNGPEEGMEMEMLDFKILNIPFARTHDAALTYGINTVDVSCIFRDFSKNVNDPASYDFRETDLYIKNMIDAGCEPFYRLGQSIENQTAAKYNIYPPKDYLKWAKICEHIIRHYNEGWADGFHYNIRYWEIWNEADLDQNSGRWKTEPRTWGAPIEEFHKMYAVAAKHLKEKFPHLKIGGPSYCRIQGTKTYFPEFFAYMRDNKVPIDFISWHKYGAEPEVFRMEADLIRGWMKEYGYSDAELILNEWNYRRFKNPGKGSSYENYNRESRRGLKGAAFAGAVMATMHYAPVDMLMYYDYRPDTSYSGFYDIQTMERQPTFYTFYAWNKLRGNACACRLSEEDDVYAVAASNNGKTTIFMTRYDGDNNACNVETVKVSLAGGRINKGFYHITDASRLYTEFPLFPNEDGTVDIDLLNNSIVLVEFE